MIVLRREQDCFKKDCFKKGTWLILTDCGSLGRVVRSLTVFARTQMWIRDLVCARTCFGFPEHRMCLVFFYLGSGSVLQTPVVDAV